MWRADSNEFFLWTYLHFSRLFVRSIYRLVILKLLIRNANQSQPVLQHLDNALTEEEFQSVQECLIDHPMRHSNVNSDEAFGNTRGFVVSFNEEGITDLENHDLFKCLSPYFQRHRLPNCNAWILNMVWANVPAYDKEFAISRHVRIPSGFLHFRV